MRSRSDAAHRILRTLVSKGIHGILDIDTLAAEAGVSRRQIFLHLAALENAKLLTRTRGNHCSRYRIHTLGEPSEAYRPMDNDQDDSNTMTLPVTNDQSTTVPGPVLLSNKSLPSNGHSTKLDRLHSGPIIGQQPRFNHPALRDILRELEIEFTDDYDNLELRCFMDTTCHPHAKATLNIRCNDGDRSTAGVWKCFRCGRRGFIDQLVRAWTGWGVFATGLYLLKHQAYDDPHDDVKRTYKPVEHNDLRQYQYRHQYCHDRGLDEETCLRYNLGFDQRDWMITMPVYTHDKTLVAIKKRAVSGKVFQYLPTAEHRNTLFGMQYVQPDSIIWFCEGEFDAMFVDQTLRRYGMRGQSAVALMGKELPDRVVSQVQEQRPIYCVIALDNDTEGKQAASVLHAQLSSLQIPCMIMRYENEQTKDPNASSEAHLATQALRVQSLASGKVIS